MVFQYMMFVDGENFAIQGSKVATDAGICLEVGPYYRPGTFLWLPKATAGSLLSYVYFPHPHLPPQDVDRSFYYTSVQGSGEVLAAVRRQLKACDFMPRVFRKPKNGRSKRVDITLATEALDNAHFGNYEVALLIAGDEDYVPLVEAIQRMGKRVVLAFFEGAGFGVSDELVLHADDFVPINEAFLDRWRWRLGTDG